MNMSRRVRREIQYTGQKGEANFMPVLTLLVRHFGCEGESKKHFSRKEDIGGGFVTVILFRYKTQH